MLAWLAPDGQRILAARAVRTFAYGFQAVLLGVYLNRAGWAPWQVGAILTATLLGSAALTAVFAATADRYGRRRILMLSALGMVGSGVAFAVTTSYPVLLLVALTGTVGVTTGEVGPFLSLEQAMLPLTTSADRRTRAFSLYNLVGALAGSLGALAAGVPALLQRAGLTADDAFRVMFLVYAALGMVTLRLFSRLGPHVEAVTVAQAASGLRRSRGTVLRLAALFVVDSLAGGFVVQSMIAFYFSARWGAGPDVLGPVFLGAGLLQAASFYAAGRLGERIGLVNTMVATHLPSNVLLMAIPLAPSLAWAIGLLLARFALSQMDVPVRQSYVVAVVDPEERIAAAGLTNIVRNVAQATTPLVAGASMQLVGLGAPFVIAGAMKIAYDLLLFACFRHIRPPEETGRMPAGATPRAAAAEPVPPAPAATGRTPWNAP
ncbi:MAG: MFS transporter [Armatimonadota bacterium]|nr:MFS transporter [Armatimonadota bacterium]